MHRVTCLAVAASLIGAADAEATLVYERPATHAIVAARDDGSAPHVIAHGFFPVVSPDGDQVLFFTPAQSPDGGLRVIGIDGRGARRLMRHAYLDPDVAAKSWAPHGHYVIAGDETSGETNVLDLEAGNRHVLSNLKGTYAGATFSPDSRRVVVADADFSSDLSHLVVCGVRCEHPRRIAYGDSPLWGSTALAFAGASAIEVKHRLDAPPKHVFPRQQYPYLFPVDWSPRGTWLLVARGPVRDQLRAYFVRPRDRKAVRIPGAFRELAAMSHDSKSVLGTRGGNVVRVTRTGVAEILAYSARSPSWTN